MHAAHDLGRLSTFLTVIQTGSVSAAARTLHISQPTLTRQLQSLERAMNTPLLNRARTGVTPTDAGRALAEHARDLLHQADKLVEHVHRAAQGCIGSISLAFSPSAINGPLGQALPRLRTHLPHVDVVLHECFDDEQMEQGVLARRYDIAVHRLPAKRPDLQVRSWVTESLSLFIPEHHPAARSRRPIRPDELTMPLLLWPRDAAARAHDEVLTLLREAGVVPRIAATAQSAQTLLALVAAEIGCTVMADSYRSLNRAGVIHRPISGTVTTVNITTRATASALEQRVAELLIDG